MEKKSKVTSILTGSVLTATLLGVSSLTATSNGLFNYSSLGSSSEVRVDLLQEDSYSADAYELKCGTKKDTTKTGDHKCGKSKDHKCGKDQKCGEGKCGEKKK